MGEISKGETEAAMMELEEAGLVKRGPPENGEDTWILTAEGEAMCADVEATIAVKNQPQEADHGRQRH